MIDSFIKYSKLNPYKGMNRENMLVRHKTKDSKINYYLLESWITGKEDQWLTSNAGQFRIALDKYGLTCQEWYDIAVLGFTDISERPKCPCGKDVEFALCFGYRPYCSKSCQARYTMTEDKCIKMHKAWKDDLNDPEIRKEFSEKQRQGQLGMKRDPDAIRRSIETKIARGHNRLSEESRRKISIANKKNYSGNEEAIDRIMSVGYHRTKNGIYKAIKCSYPIRYLSSWELDFMKICDNLNSVVKIEKGMRFRYLNSAINEYKTYVSDFTITLSNGDRMVVEIKPECFIYKQMVTDKRNAAIEKCNELGIKYIMLTKSEIYSSNNELNMSLDLIEICKFQYRNSEWSYK